MNYIYIYKIYEQSKIENILLKKVSSPIFLNYQFYEINITKSIISINGPKLENPIKKKKKLFI